MSLVSFLYVDFLPWNGISYVSPICFPCLRMFLVEPPWSSLDNAVIEMKEQYYQVVTRRWCLLT